MKLTFPIQNFKFKNFNLFLKLDTKQVNQSIVLQIQIKIDHLRRIVKSEVYPH